MKREEMRERDAEVKTQEVLGNGKPGIIRQISAKEVPLEREAYSTDEDSEGTYQIDAMANGDKSAYEPNGISKGRNGHAIAPRRHPQTSMVR